MKHYLKYSLFLLWISAIGVMLYFVFGKGYSPSQISGLVQSLVAEAGLWGPLLYIFLYTIRTATFFPATVFTVASGFIFGPALGILYTFIALNCAAVFAFLMGRYFGATIFAKAGTKLKFFPSGEKLRENGFLSVLLMRLLYFPFDWVGYICGAYTMKLREFFLGTLVGTIPGMISFVLLGAALDFSDPKSVAINVGIGLFFFVLGIVISKQIKKRSSYGAELAKQQEELKKETKNTQ